MTRLLFAIPLLSGYSAAQLVNRPAPPADAVERGQKVFVASCGFCHGANAKGGEGGPDLVRSPIVLDDENGDQIGPVILQGRTGKGMPAFPMMPAQISDIAAFLRARSQAAIDRIKYDVGDLLTGDRNAGETFFREQCASCHSVTGDLAGIGSKFKPEALQARFLYPARGRDRKPAEVSVTLPGGRTVKGTLEYLDDFTVSLRDSDQYYRTYPLEGAKVEVRDPLERHAELLKKYTDTEMHNILAYLMTAK